MIYANGAQPAAIRLHAAFDNDICSRPHLIKNTRFGGCAGVYWSKILPTSKIKGVINWYDALHTFLL